MAMDCSKLVKAIKSRWKIQKEGHAKGMVNIDELTKTEIKLDILLKAEQGKFSNTNKKIQAQKEALKKAVDMHTDNLMKELAQKWETIQKSIEAEQERVKPLKQNLNDQIIKTKDLMNSNYAVKVFSERMQLSQSLNAVQPLVVELNFISIPIFIPWKITQNNVGTLQDVFTDINITVSNQYTCTLDISRFNYMSSCCDGTLWISDQRVIQKVKTDEDNLNVISNYNMKIGMATTPSNDLLLASDPVMKQIFGNTGELTDTLYSVDPLRISAVHVTNDLEILAGATTPRTSTLATKRRVVIRINKEGKHEKTYEDDRNKQPIFTYVYNITSTTNGTIFVVDCLSDDGRGRVVVLGQDGDVLNTYTGHQKLIVMTNHSNQSVL